MNRFPWIPTGLLLAGCLTVGIPAVKSAPVVPEAIPIPLALSWKYSAVNVGDPLPGRNNPTSPVVADGVVYFCAPSVTPDKVVTTSVFAVSLETGEKLWDHPLEGTVFSTPVVSGNTVWVADTKGYLYALDCAKEGTERARFQLSRGIHSSPVVQDGVAYIGDDGGLVLAVDTNSMQERWRFQAGGHVEAPIAVSPEQKLVFVSSGEPMLYALRLDTGKEYWRVKMPDVAMDAAPQVLGDNLYAVSGCNLYCLTVRKGQVKWNSAQMRTTTGSTIIGTPALAVDADGANATLYFGCRDRTVYALKASSGMPVWKAPILLDRVPKTSAVVTDKVILLGADGGFLYALSRDNGKLLWKYRVLPPQDIAAAGNAFSVSGDPVVVDDRLMMLSDEGTLHCFAPDAVDDLPPVVTGTEPDSKTPIYGRPPVQFKAVISDEGSGVDESKLVFKLDGKVVKHSFNPVNGELTYATPVTQPIRPLADGRHTASVTVVDWKGNQQEYEWVFQVDNRKVPAPPKTQQPGMEGMPGGMMMPPM